MDIKQKIGKRIKELRAIKGFSQEELAARADIDRTYVIRVNFAASHCVSGCLDRDCDDIFVRTGH